MARFIVFIFAVWLAAAPARSEIDQAALQLYVDGAFEEAAEAAEAAGGAENLALAARALNAGAYLTEDNKTARLEFERAQAYAEASIAIDPNLVEGHLQAAIALAQRGARMASWRALVLGLARRSREEIDAALAIDPDSAWALSMSAGWHVEVARRGGAGTFGSDPQIGRRQFMAAYALDPENVAISYECALRLLAYDDPAWRPDALKALAAAAGDPPRDAFERQVQSRAKGLVVAIVEGKKAERAYINSQL